MHIILGLMFWFQNMYWPQARLCMKHLKQLIEYSGVILWTFCPLKHGLVVETSLWYGASNSSSAQPVEGLMVTAGEINYQEKENIFFYHREKHSSFFTNQKTRGQIFLALTFKSSKFNNYIIYKLIVILAYWWFNSKPSYFSELWWS